MRCLHVLLNTVSSALKTLTTVEFSQFTAVFLQDSTRRYLFWKLSLTLGISLVDFCSLLHALLPWIWFTSRFSAQGLTPIRSDLRGLTWVESKSHLGLGNLFGPVMTSPAYRSTYWPWPSQQADTLADSKRNPVETGLWNPLWVLSLHPRDLELWRLSPYRLPSHPAFSASLTAPSFLLQISNLSATFAEIFLEIIQSNLPEGVKLSVKEVGASFRRGPLVAHLCSKYS